jgi:hypothetical protein
MTGSALIRWQRVLRGAEDADEGGVHDANGEWDDSGSVVGKVPGYVGKVPLSEAARRRPQRPDRGHAR